MGFSNAGGAVNEQGIIHLPRVFGYGDGGAVGEPVGGAHHEVVKGELGVKVHGGGGLVLFQVVVPLRVSEYQELGIGIEDLFQGILDIVRAPAADDLPAEIRGGVENQVGFVQLHHLRVVEPGRHGHGAQAFLHVAEDLCPHIGG